ncbi:hypothetical protein FG386_001940 [Cryptosporidium ryanae]|uniref:uncharacterized protein n=1 Tax=Cryptosporidium ryanae TaxID=515981 RepID=UPI00351A44BF|nr:hypothetical protein FG386_001940 [Cryptosporidium ryanae]
MLGISKASDKNSQLNNDSSIINEYSRLQTRLTHQSPELYKRFIISTGVYAMFGSIVGGTIGSFLFKSSMSRRFALGVGFGTGLGWGIKSADDYIKYSERRNYIPPIPKSSDEWIDRGITSFQKIRTSLIGTLDKKTI